MKAWAMACLAIVMVCMLAAGCGDNVEPTFKNRRGQTLRYGMGVEEVEAILGEPEGERYSFTEYDGVQVGYRDGVAVYYWFRTDEWGTNKGVSTGDDIAAAAKAYGFEGFDELYGFDIYYRDDFKDVKYGDSTQRVSIFDCDFSLSFSSRRDSDVVDYIMYGDRKYLVEQR